MVHPSAVSARAALCQLLFGRVTLFSVQGIISGLGRELSTGLFPIKNVIQVGPEAGGTSFFGGNKHLTAMLKNVRSSPLQPQIFEQAAQTLEGGPRVATMLLQ
jgi:hypothetical protein